MDTTQVASFVQQWVDAWNAHDLDALMAHFADDAHALGDGVAACVPLRADERIVGALVVFGLLPHKPAFEPVDHELFKLLSAHAAPAFYGAQLFEGSGRALPRPNASSTVTGSTR